MLFSSSALALLLAGCPVRAICDVDLNGDGDVSLRSCLRSMTSQGTATTSTRT